MTYTQFHYATTIQWSLLLMMMMILHHSISMTSGFVLPAVTTSSTTTTGTIGDSLRSHGLQIPVVEKYGTAIVRQMNDRASTTTTTTAFALPKSKATVSSSSKEILLDLILNQTPAGRATPSQLTQRILQQIQSMSCPTPDNQVLPALAGSWELLWTAQDPSQPESQRWSNKIINPIEDQSFSNNPEGGGVGNNNMGRSNPFLPMGIQNLLEQFGIVSTSPSSTTRRSTQAIDIKSRTIRNIVAIQFNNNINNRILTPRRLFGAAQSPSINTSVPPSQRRIALTVMVKFTPVQSDARRVNVKFTECRISIPSFSSQQLSSSSSINERNQHPKRSNNNLEYTFPLGLIGPTGWLRTIYIDDTLRITRGHKGSVFVLSRPRRATV